MTTMTDEERMNLLGCAALFENELSIEAIGVLCFLHTAHAAHCGPNPIEVVAKRFKIDRDRASNALNELIAEGYARKMRTAPETFDYVPAAEPRSKSRATQQP